MSVYLVRVVKTVTLLVEGPSPADIVEALTSETSPVDLAELLDDPDVEVKIIEEIDDPLMGRHVDGLVHDKTFFFADVPMPEDEWV